MTQWFVCVLLTSSSPMVCWPVAPDPVCTQQLSDWILRSREWLIRSGLDEEAPSGACKTTLPSGALLQDDPLDQNRAGA
jgi:hypothetical protein